ncbi:hypothetical protein C0J52_04926 [Blattella germanica]|nr:hypothetical protein C0J52_04926 [Blattella germanica]
MEDGWGPKGIFHMWLQSIVHVACLHKRAFEDGATRKHGLHPWDIILHIIEIDLFCATVKTLTSEATEKKIFLVSEEK